MIHLTLISLFLCGCHYSGAISQAAEGGIYAPESVDKSRQFVDKSVDK